MSVPPPAPKRHAGLEKVRAGLRTFHQKVVPQNRAFYAKLAEGQAPKALFIGCSDSRVDPNLMTQSAPGELFVVRNAGAIVPPYRGDRSSGETGSIEYAVRALKVKHIIVCGHTHCGAMTAVAKNSDLSSLPAMQHWLRHATTPARIEAALQEPSAVAYTDGTSKRVDATIRAGIVQQLHHLEGHPSVAEALKDGSLHLHGWVYSIDTGLVREYDAEHKHFVPYQIPAHGVE